MSKIRTVCASPTVVAMAGALLTFAADAVHAQHVHPRPAPDSAKSSALTAEMEAVRRATGRYRDHANAVADGYRRFGTESALMGEHWYHPDLVRAPLDLERPSRSNTRRSTAASRLWVSRTRFTGDPVTPCLTGSREPMMSGTSMT